MNKSIISRLKLSIRKLLITLLVVSVSALLLLGGTANYSNSKVAENQERLIKASNLQSIRDDIVTALQLFLIRQGEIIALTTISELTGISERKDLVATIRRNGEDLHQGLINTMADTDKVEQQITTLNNAFNLLLEADSGVYEQTQKILQLENQLIIPDAEVIKMLAIYQSSVDELFEEIEFEKMQDQLSMKRLLNNDIEFANPQVASEFRSTASRLISVQKRRTDSLSADIRSDSANLAVLIGLISLADNNIQLISLVENRIQPVADKLMVSLVQLSTYLTDNQSVLDLNVELRKQFTDLLGILITEDKSIVNLTVSINKAREMQNSFIIKQSDATQTMTNALAELTSTTDEIQLNAIKSSQLVMDASEYSMIVVNVIAIAIVISMGIGIMILVLRPLGIATHALQDIGEGEGDLTRRLASAPVSEINDLALAFNQFAEKMQLLVKSVAKASCGVSDSTDYSAEISRMTSEQISEQQQETEQMVTAVTKMSNTVAVIAKNTESAAESAHKANSRASKGKQVVEDSFALIESLATDIECATKSLEKLIDDSQNVNRVLEVIRNIAGQTNLLALNAAIEAARAGEQGRGFAVVADEVRSLAQKTQDSTVEIQGIVEQLHENADDVAKTISASHQRVKQAVEQSKATSSVFDGIACSIRTINDMNTQIASAAMQQSLVTEDINRMVVNINTVAAKTSDGACKAANVSEDLAQLGHELKHMVTHFKA